MKNMQQKRNISLLVALSILYFAWIGTLVLNPKHDAHSANIVQQSSSLSREKKYHKKGLEELMKEKAELQHRADVLTAKNRTSEAKDAYTAMITIDDLITQKVQSLTR